MNVRYRLWAMLGTALLAALCVAAPSSAQEQAGDDRAKKAEPSASERLAMQQNAIAEKYKHLEEVLLRMAELNAASDPRRAALLKKAVAQSKEQLIGVRFERLVELLGKEQLSRALENQTDLDQDLRALLDLLMSENRDKTIKDAKTRVREYLKVLGVLLKRQKDIQGRTANGDDPKQLAEQQGKVAEKTGGLAKDIKKNEEKGESGKSSKGNSGKDEKGTSKGGKDDKSDGKGEKSKSGEREDGSQSPARKRLEAAQQRMNEAEKKLDEANRQDAVDKQEEAVRELERAKKELEEILRQLREEEIERVLAMLEGRFRKMLQWQEEVYDGTVLLDRIPESQRTHNQEIEASRLSSKESQIVVEVDKAMLVLREDGGAVAFPEAVEQMRDDMQQVVSRLAAAKVGTMTQGIEEDIITALKEMIAALKKAQKDQSQKKKKPGEGGQAGEPEDPPLVDKLAELRMIRALQMRVNTRTTRYSRMVEGEQADSPELVEALRRLAERQQRIYRVTRDLELGKNQ